MNEYYSRAGKGADALSDEIKYKLLSNGRRRAVVEELYEHGPLTKSQLADKLTERSDETPSGQERKRIYISLHQQHIPKLMSEGVILEGDDGFVLGSNAGPLIEEIGCSEEPENGENGGSGENGGGGFRDRLGGLLKGSS